MASGTILGEGKHLIRVLENALQEVETSRLSADAKGTVGVQLDSIIANLRYWFSEAVGVDDFQALQPSAKAILSKMIFDLERALGAFRYRYVDCSAPLIFILNARRLSALMSDLASITSDLKRLWLPSGSITLEATLAAEADPSVNPAELSRKVRRWQCQITASCEGNTISYRDPSFGMKILRNDPSSTVVDSACRRLRSDPTAGQNFVGQLLYPRYAFLRISSKQVSYASWCLGGEFEELLRKKSMEMSLHSILPDRDAMPQLELHLYLSGVPIYPSPGNSYTDILLTAILGKLRRNWTDQQYLPDIHSKAILSIETIYHLALEDDELSQWTNGERTHVKEIIKTWLADSSNMLVSCISQRLSLSLLKYAVEQGFTDSSPPPQLTYSSKAHTPKTSDAKTDLRQGMTEESAVRDYENQIWKLQPRFSARKIPPSRALFQLDPTDILPLYYPAQGGGKLPSDGRSEIHKVCIEPGYQTFTNNPLDTFIIKKFHVSFGMDGATTGESTTNEGFARLSHNHLVTHLAGWTTEDEICLLFPTPQLTLREFLKAPRSNLSSEEFLASLAPQLLGLAEAVYFLHNIDHRDSIETSISKSPRRGFHHDIKPENIYLFASSSGIGYDWKLGNFGAEITSSGISGAPGKQINDHREDIYQSPETATRTSTSRATDIWSLGCVFLEVLIFAFGLNVGSDKVIDHFWEVKEPSKTAVLSKSVTESLEKLTSRAENMSPLHDLIKSVRERVLVIDPNQRETAAALVQDLGKILDPESHIQAEMARVDLADILVYPDDAVSKVQSRSSLDSSVRNTVFSDRASESSYSTSGSPSLHPNEGIGAVDGWSITELGLGVEPHYLDKVKQWQLEVTEVSKMSLFPVIQARGDLRTWWTRLSLEEQTACIGNEVSSHDRSYDSYLPKGALAELWNEKVLPMIGSILENERERRRLQDVLLSCDLRLLAGKTGSSRKPVPTIMIVSRSRKAAKAAVSVISKNAAFSLLNLGFTFVAYNEIINFL